MTPTLPVLACRDQILATLEACAAMVVVGATGSGKSTQIPRMFMEAGYRVLVTEPRRLAASTLAERVAAEMGVPVGGLVGYRTGRDVPHDGPETCLWYMTDALVLMRELCGNGGGYDVLVLDEIHEFGLTAEVLLAWARRAIAAGARFKLVLLSATLDAEALAAYLGTPDRPAPIVWVPGQLHPIEAREPSRYGFDMPDILDAMATDIRGLVAGQREVLAFVPGKGEIDSLTLRLENLDAEILPLHGQMSREDQARCFQAYPRPRVVVATNIAQTSLTIDGIDAVVDCGYERRVETRGGVEGIYLATLSEASSTQRRGRAGRTKPGICVDHKPPGDHPAFPVPEIRRVLLDQAVLRLAQAGLDMAALPFLHQPPPHQIDAAKEMLRKLGAMTEDGKVTEMGALIARLPVSVRAGRALVEASRLRGRALLDAVAAACAMVDVGSIGNDRMGRAWRRWAGPYADSDLLAQTRALDAVGHLPAEELELLGFLPLKVTEAREQRLEIARVASEVLGEDDFPDRPFDVADVVRCMAAGMVDQLRLRTWNDQGWPVFGLDERRIGRESVVNPGPRLDPYEDDDWDTPQAGPDRADLWVVGLPFDIGAPRGTVNVLRAVSVVSLSDMERLAPEAVVRHLTDVDYSPMRDQTTAWEVVTLFGEVVAGRRVPLDPHPGAGARLRDFLTRAYQGAMPKDWGPSLKRLADLLTARARALAENARLGEDRWPQPPVAELVARIPDDATSLAPHLGALVVAAPPPKVPVSKGQKKRARGALQG
jgi:ATP-dependent helicase HrpA